MAWDIEGTKTKILTAALAEFAHNGPETDAEHAEDWHMLQPVFDADLDQERLARSHAREQQVANKEDA
ncbi:MAG: hypothetical protein ACFNLH_06680 [Corynebacterium matruchotii]